MLLSLPAFFLLQYLWQSTEKNHSDLLAKDTLMGPGTFAADPLWIDTQNMATLRKRNIRCGLSENQNILSYFTCHFIKTKCCCLYFCQVTNSIILGERRRRHADVEDRSLDRQTL